MNKVNNWNYEAITEQASQRITSLMMLSTKKASEEEARIFQQWAYGAYLLWENLTMGWQNGGDSSRLLALLEIPGVKRETD